MACERPGGARAERVKVPAGRPPASSLGSGHSASGVPGAQACEERAAGADGTRVAWALPIRLAPPGDARLVASPKRGHDSSADSVLFGICLADAIEGNRRLKVTASAAIPHRTSPDPN